MRDHLRITSTEEDGLLAAYILAARDWVENETKTRLVTQTLDYTIDYCWPHHVSGYYCNARIELPVRPVASVTSITYVDGNGATQTLNSSQYVFHADAAAPYIDAAYGVTWPTVRAQSAAITVRFVAGWAAPDVPHSLLQAIRFLTAHLYATREAVTTANGAQQITEVPLALEAMISSHRYSRFV